MAVGMLGVAMRVSCPVLVLVLVRSGGGVTVDCWQVLVAQRGYVV